MVDRRPELMPVVVRYSLAVLARRSPSARLYASVPRSSQCPSIWVLTEGFAFKKAAFLSRIARASGRRSYLSKSKLTSWFWNSWTACWNVIPETWLDDRGGGGGPGGGAVGLGCASAVGGGGSSLWQAVKRNVRSRATSVTLERTGRIAIDLPPFWVSNITAPYARPTVTSDTLGH